MPIFLIGFMGVGKTTVGKEIGLLKGLPVIDMDHFIEEKEGRAIKEIFREDGEHYFRTIETQALKELKKKEAVITTGGGIIERKENRNILSESGKVVHLHCSFDEVWERLEGDSERPLVQKNSRVELQKLYNRRLPLYREARNAEIDTTGKSIEEILQELRRLVDS
jgi:shikimate kinase